MPIGESVPVGRAEDMRAGLRSAPTLMVYEGLPHQTKEKVLLEREVQRADVTRLLGYPFYKPPVPAKQNARLKSLLGDANNYGTYTGPKTCGGFHPDYAVSWTAEGEPHFILICFGCGEALFWDGRRLMPYDIKHGPLSELMGLLVGHVSKRPPGG